ncbi:MAG: histone deacetylase family protein [Hydrogenophilales bacterium]|nr:histone deacetylase family protein [Hydrogenophilales bacterium]
MQTAYITHPSYLLHDMGSWHPESPARLRAIDDRLHAAHLFDHLIHLEATRVQRSQLLRVHDAAYIDFVEAASPSEGLRELDPDTSMNPHTLEAAWHAAGGAVMAVDRVLRGEVTNAFVACRPPGHHATRNQAMGFCLFNNVAVAAAHALEEHGLERVAIVDFDVHHGNGTEDIFRDEPRLMLCSTFQHPYYPFRGADTVSDHIVNVPLPAGTTGTAYREAFTNLILPRLEAFRPQMLFFSAGFDGHREDDMAQFGLVEADYAWITGQVMDVAARHAGGRIVSVLEGGYDLSSLGRSVAAHIKTLAAL